MARTLLVVPAGRGVGLTSVCLGIVRALDRLGVPYGFCRPISVRDGVDRSTALMRALARLEPPAPMSRADAERMLGEGQEDVLLEEVVRRVQAVSVDAAVVVVEGVVPVPEVAYAARLNVAMAKALDAELVFVDAPMGSDPSTMANRADIAARAYGEVTGGQLRSCILNRVRIERQRSTDSPSALAVERLVGEREVAPYVEALRREGLHPLGVIPWVEELASPRTLDLAAYLGARTIHEGQARERRILDTQVCAAGVREAQRVMGSGTLVITHASRDDVLQAAALRELSGVHLAGVLLTGGGELDSQTLDLVRPALERGLPLYAVDGDTYPTAIAVHNRPSQLCAEDHGHARMAMNVVANHLDGMWLAKLAASARERRMTTPAFRHGLIKRARGASKRVVLPEGTEPRTLAAAAICAERRIAVPVLLAEPAAVRRACLDHGIRLPDGVEVVDPASVRERYVAPMVALRQHRGLTADQAAGQLEDAVVLGTMMLACDDVDGLVSGAMHSTANTIRPALQLIKTAPGTKLVSSVFFMCLPDQVLVYGDCAVNPDPTADELAEIALQCADSAAAFGIEPRVAMLSYSTGTSGAGKDVKKVARATELARSARPGLLIDGPLQYDAAAIAEVGRKKAPNSQVAGRATVFVFPDLNAGNTTYKAVQRSAGVVSMGPMLQGLAKPVNDLSRGAGVDDIVFTIALTAIQAIGAEPG
jgi:phosphate acetyltransferase